MVILTLCKAQAIDESWLSKKEENTWNEDDPKNENDLNDNFENNDNLKW